MWTFPNRVPLLNFFVLSLCIIHTKRHDIPDGYSIMWHLRTISFLLYFALQVFCICRQSVFKCTTKKKIMNFKPANYSSNAAKALIATNRHLQTALVGQQDALIWNSSWLVLINFLNDTKFGLQSYTNLQYGTDFSNPLNLSLLNY